MSLTRITCIATFALVSAICQAAQMPWAKSLSEAQAKAKSSRRFVMVFFRSKACDGCDRFERTTLSNDGIVKRVAAGCVPVKINIDDPAGKAAAAKFTIGRHPVVVYTDAAGKEVGRLDGPMPPILFGDENDKLVSMGREWPGLQKAYKANSKDGELNAKMAWAVAIQRKEDDAERYLANAKKAKYTGSYLARAHNMTGDIYQLTNRIDEALAHFQKADTAAKTLNDRAYARVSIMACYQQQNNLAKAKEAAKALISLKGANPEYLKYAQQVLKGN